MPYPPQESMNSPAYLSTEIYQAEQTPPGGESAGQASSLPPIIVYADRIRSARFLSGITNGLFLSCALMLLVVYGLAYLTREGYTSQTLLGLYVICFLSVLICIKLALARWLGGRSLLVNAQPLLLVDSHGISIRGAYALDNLFLAWSEIEAIERYQQRYDYLGVRPRAPRLLAERVPLYQRLLRLSDVTSKLPLLILSSAYLDKPVEEILQQMYHIYAQQLDHHQVQIRL